ncbi:MAG: ATP-dependent RNA helicase HrpA [Planctomycetota bacterium]
METSAASAPGGERPAGSLRIDDAMRGDRAALRRLWKKIVRARREGRPHDRNLARFERQLEESAERRKRRAGSVPALEYPAELPVSQVRGEIAELIGEHRVTVVCGQTGSGKSTQLPKVLLGLGLGVAGTIAHTQPRRIAAQTLAARVAGELKAPLGGPVGYAVRFDDRSGPDTLVRYMTDGLLLAELADDPDLSRYDAVIVDEAHERSLNIDFLLGYLRRLLPRRPDLKVVVTSATIDAERFAAFFGIDGGGEGEAKAAPIIEVSGRTYPVEVRYRPIEADEESDEPDAAAADRALREAFDEALDSTDGDVLVFMPTERAIRESAKTLRHHLQYGGRSRRRVELLPLYGRLSSKEQQRAFRASTSARRVVIATNVAESSVTVPNVTAVIDTGTARTSRYSARARMQRLPIEPVSRASADQRAGRCGRVAPGVCVRLYSEDDYLARGEFTTPEVLRTSLASVMLRSAAMGLGALEDFPFLDAPKPAALREGRQTLIELGAIDAEGGLTKVGRRLAQLPTDPRVGRMVLAGAEEKCLAEVLVIASAIEGQDPRLRPMDRAEAADAAHAEFADASGDFMGFVRLWRFLHSVKAKASRSGFQRACESRFISPARVREWFELHRQLRDLAADHGLGRATMADKPWGNPKMVDAVHRALLTGLLSNVAYRSAPHEYTGAHGGKLRLWPGSSVFAAEPKWIVSGEVVETTQRYARTIGRVDPAWVERAGAHLLKRSHAEPHWFRRGGYAAVYEKVKLYGLVLTPRRRVPLAGVDRAAAREVLLREGLVAEEVDVGLPFLEHNRAVRLRASEVRAKRRRADPTADEAAAQAYYERRVPESILTAGDLRRWWVKASKRDPALLHMTEADLLGDAEDDPGRPNHLEVAGARLRLAYRHAPGEADDGVTLLAPLHLLMQLDARVIEWGVPGDLEGRVTALIRSLPKAQRKPLVPAPESAAEASGRIAFGEGKFLEAVADALGHVAGSRLDPAAFDVGQLEPHHWMNVAVIDEKEERLGQSRDLAALQRRFADRARKAVVQAAPDAWQRDGLTSWEEIGELPESIDVTRGAAEIRAYPAVVDQRTAVGVRAIETAERAAGLHAAGVERLCVLTLGGKARRAVVAWPGLAEVLLAGSVFGHAGDVQDGLVRAAVRRACGAELDRAMPRTRAAFDAVIAVGRSGLEGSVDEVCRVASAVYAEASPLSAEVEAIAARTPPGWDAAVAQLREQLRWMVSGDFLDRTPRAWLAHVPRYLRGGRHRLRKLREGRVERDRAAAAELDARLTDFAEVARGREKLAEVVAYRWLLEEYRVRLFAEELGTSVKVSPRRLDEQRERAMRA